MKYIIIFLLITFYNSTQLFSQPDHNSIIKLGAISPLFSTLDIAYERKIPNTYFTLQVNTTWTINKKIASKLNSNVNVDGNKIEIQARSYFDKLIDIDYFYWGGALEFWKYQINSDHNAGLARLLNINHKALNIIFGLQVELPNNLFVDLTLGGGLHISKLNLFNEINSSKKTGILPKFALKVGYGF